MRDWQEKWNLEQMLLKSISMQRAGPGLAKARQLLEQSMAAGGKQAQEEEATNIFTLHKCFLT